jgi:membrane protein DedA with SNARE-associated domain
MMDLLTGLLDVAAALPAPAVLAATAVLLMVESGTLVGIVLPGSTLLVALGLWAHLVPTALPAAVAVAAAATVAGANLGWWLGRSGSGWGRRPAAQARAERAHRWLAGRGGPATAVLLVCGHWAAVARPIMPRVAGGAGVPYRIAGPALAASGSAWAATLVLLGNRVGPHVLTHVGWAPVAVVALVVAVLVVRARQVAQIRPDLVVRPTAQVVVHVKVQGRVDWRRR